MKKFVLAIAAAVLPMTASAGGFCTQYDCQGTADRVISKDSRSWMMNRYDYGSARIRNVWESPSGLDVELMVDYTYNNGRRGWVEIEVFDGRVRCLRFHDFANTCRPER